MISQKFPNEVKEMAYDGLFTLFESVDQKILLARDDESAFLFSGETGEFIKKQLRHEVDMSNFQRLNLVDENQVANLWKFAETIK